MESMNWTLETYRLDEVERKFGLPCVIHLNEGYYSVTDAEGFSQGDVMSIDSKMILHKVAANFAKDITSNFEKVTDQDYIQLASLKEILIPLSYKGNLKIIQQKRTYENVKELAEDFPRYARLRLNLAVLTEDNKTLTIQAGTVIELDRIIPGSTFGSASTPDRLIIQFTHLLRRAVVALPLDLNGKFITEQDDNEYTIKEAIDRYSLPQCVRFVDSAIKRVYTQDLNEGISNVKCLSDTYRLNRLVTQEVLVGHYKPVVAEASAGNKAFKQRTLILLPTDNPEIRNIEVNVLNDVTEDTYEHIFLVRNVSRSEEDLMDGTLYIDFADSPGIRRFSKTSTSHIVNVPAAYPPPLPPKPVHISPFTDGTSATLPRHPGRLHSTSEQGGYKHGTSATLPRHPGRLHSTSEQGGYKPSFNLATLPKSKPRSYSDCTSQAKSHTPWFNNEKDDYVQMSSPDVYDTDDVETSSVELNSDKDNLSDIVDYQEVDEFKKDPEGQQKKKPLFKVNSKDKQKHKYKYPCYENVGYNKKPTAKVSPTNSIYDQSLSGKKLFRDLSTVELAERLNQGGLNDLSDLCKRERLNGSFFLNLSRDTLKKTMGLKNLQLAKFLQMRDENWIPT